MKVKIEDNKSCQKLIKIEIEPAKVTEALGDIYKSIGKSAQIPGFRKGKVPLELLKIHYNEAANDEAIKHLAWDAYLEVIKTNNIKPVSYPVIEDVKFDGSGSLAFTVKIDIEPIIKLAPYTNIKIKKSSAQVTEEEIDKAINGIRESMATAQPDGKKTMPPLDDELAKKAGDFQNLQQLRERVKEELLYNKRQHQHADMENQLFEFLVKANQFQVPESVLQSELSNLVNDAKLRLAYQGYKKEDIDAQESKLKESLAINAGRQVKIFFILDKIAEKESIAVTDDELDKRLEDIAKATQQDAQKFKQAMNEKGLKDNLREQMLHNKAIEFLLSKAKIDQA